MAGWMMPAESAWHYDPCHMSTAARPSPPGRLRGILAEVGVLQAALHVAFVVLTLGSAVRFLSGHGLGGRTPMVIGGAALLLFLYAVRRFAEPHASAWCLALVVLWVVLTASAPSFSWCAVPLAFVALRVLAFGRACLVVTAMIVTVVAAWSRMLGEINPTIVLGPVWVAVLAVMAYRALERDAAERQRLLDELRQAQGELADAQHRAGALAERARLSREIRDSVAQGLSSINLLLLAAQHDWGSRPMAAQEHVAQAALTARDGIEEVRRVVRDLAPANLPGHDTAALISALRETCQQAVLQTGVAVDVRVEGNPTALSAPRATALLRTARGELANVVDHARATQATVTLTYQSDSVLLDVIDDGRGFDPQRAASDPGRGRGLRGIRERVATLGGTMVMESALGEGTALAVCLPMNVDEQKSSAGRPATAPSGRYHCG